MTNTTPEPVDAIVDEVESMLFPAQQRRREALVTAASLMVTEREPIRGSFAAVLGATVNGETMGKREGLADDLVQLAEFIIGDDVDPRSRGTLYLPDGGFIEVFGATRTCNVDANGRCACDDAAEFTGGEADVPAEEQEEG